MSSRHRALTRGLERKRVGLRQHVSGMRAALVQFVATHPGLTEVGIGVGLRWLLVDVRQVLAERNGVRRLLIERDGRWWVRGA